MENDSGKIDLTSYPIGQPRQAAERDPLRDDLSEQAVLGSMMMDPDAASKVVSTMKENDFGSVRHRIIFNACSRMLHAGKHIDNLTLNSELKDHNELDKAGGEAYLLEILNVGMSTSALDSYIGAVRDKSVKREIAANCRNVLNSLMRSDGVSGEEMLEQFQQNLFSINEDRGKQKASGPISVRELLSEAVSRIQENAKSNGGPTGVATGFTKLDDMMKGLHGGELIILAARPAMGKSTLGMNIMQHAMAHCDKPSIVFSLEMPSWQLVLRMLSTLSRVEFEKINTGMVRTPEAIKQLGSAMHILKERGDYLYIDDQSGLTPFELRSRAAKIHKEHGGLGVILVDYLQIMTVPGYKNDKQQEVAELSKSLKALARDLDVPVIALSQLSRDVEKRPDKRPMNSDLRESGAIEQDADAILFIYRDEYYHKESQDKGLAEIIIGKQRNGPIGTCKVLFEAQFCKFSNIQYGYDSEPKQDGASA